jgi:hypothetical protein
MEHVSAAALTQTWRTTHGDMTDEEWELIADLSLSTDAQIDGSTSQGGPIDGSSTRSLRRGDGLSVAGVSGQLREMEHCASLPPDLVTQDDMASPRRASSMPDRSGRRLWWASNPRSGPLTAVTSCVESTTRWRRPPGLAPSRSSLGDYTIALPDATGVARHVGWRRVAVLHFGAHADAGNTQFGSHYSYGTPIRRLIESGAVRRTGSCRSVLLGCWAEPTTLASVTHCRRAVDPCRRGCCPDGSVASRSRQ